MARLIFIISLFLLSCLKISAFTPIKEQYFANIKSKDDQINYRLPNNTKPEAYDIFLKTDVANGNFEFFGSVKITIRVLQTSNEITLHQRQLDITSIELVQNDGEQVTIVGRKYDKTTEFLSILTAHNALKQGSKLFLRIDYKGTLREDAGGFYRSSYTDENGKRVYVTYKKTPYVTRNT